MSRAYVWAATKDIYDEAFFRRTFHVKPGDFFQFNGYVRPERRGSPVALITMHSMHDHFLEQGSIHARTTISSRTPTSYRFHLKMGYKQTNEALDVRKLFGRRWSRETKPRVIVP